MKKRPRITSLGTLKGIPDESDCERPFARTDLCHFASVRNKNAVVWPNIGLTFTRLTKEDLASLRQVRSLASALPKSPDDFEFTLILAPEKEGEGDYAYFYSGDSDEPVTLAAEHLTMLRKCLPRVEFIRSNVPLSDQVPIASIVHALGGKSEGPTAWFDYPACPEGRC